MKDNHSENKIQQKPTDPTLADAIVSVSGAIESSNRHIAAAIHSSDKKIADALTSVAEVIDKDERSREKEVRMVFWLGVLLPVVTFLGVILTVWSSYKMEANRESLQRNYEEAQLLETHVDKYNKIADRFSEALADIREFRRAQIQNFCKKHVYTGNKKEFSKQANEKFFNLVDVLYAIRRNLDEEIYNQTATLTHSLYNEKNICAKDAVSLHQLWETGIKINDLIREKIQDTEREIIRLKNSKP